jgi:cobalamin biosynthesis Mg chelatase CobN
MKNRTKIKGWMWIMAIFALVVFADCKTSKTTIGQKTQAATKYDVEEHSRQKEQKHEQESGDVFKEQFTVRLQEYVCEVFSAPDSFGRQYVVERITANTKSDITEKSAAQTSRASSTEKSTAQAKFDKTVSEHNTQTEVTEQVKVKSPFAVNWLVVALFCLVGAGIGLAVFFILKQFKIIN